MKTNIDQVHDMVDEWCESRNPADLGVDGPALRMMRMSLHEGVDMVLKADLLDRMSPDNVPVNERFEVVGVPVSVEDQNANALYRGYMENRSWLEKLLCGVNHYGTVLHHMSEELDENGPQRVKFTFAENYDGVNGATDLLSDSHPVNIRDISSIQEYFNSVCSALPEGIEAMGISTYVALMRARTHMGLDQTPLDLTHDFSSNVGVVKAGHGTGLLVGTEVRRPRFLLIPALHVFKANYPLRQDLRMPNVRVEVPFALIN